GLGHGSDIHAYGDAERLADRQVHILLQSACKTLLANGEGIVTRRKAQKSEMTIRIGSLGLCEVRIQIFRFDICTSDTSSFFIDKVTLDRARGDLRLCTHERGNP